MLNYQVVQRNLRSGKNSKTIFYAKTQYKAVVPREQVIEQIEKISAMSSGDVKSVLDSLSYILARELALGNIVDLGDLGRMRMSVRSKAATTKELFKPNNLKKPYVIFVPGAAIRHSQASARFTRLGEGGKPIAETPSPQPGQEQEDGGGN